MTSSDRAGSAKGISTVTALGAMWAMLAMFACTERTATAPAASSTAANDAIANEESNGSRKSRIEHVLLISIDGMHQSDLTRFVRTHPASALAKLVHHGVTFTNAKTSKPSDSFPGLLAQITGGSPKSTGVYPR